MATTIKLKNGSGAPLAGDLVQGEPALDLTNKRLYTEDSGGTVIEVGTSPSTIDINAGTIDGTVIGGSSAAAGTFTTFTSTGIDDNATSTAITIDASENVGIGTAIPTTKLQVTGSGSILRVSDDTSTSGTIELSASSSVAKIHANTYSAAVPLAFEIASSEKMRIDSSGNVGIGTSSPTTKIQLGASEDAISWKSGNGIIECPSKLFLRSTGGEPVVLNVGGGNVGIGTDSPSYQLDVEFGNDGIGLNSVSNTTYAEFYEAGARKADLTYRHSNATARSDILELRTVSGDIAFRPAETEAMRIDSSGRVGIGTASINGKLDIKTSNAGFEFYPENSTDTNLIINFDRSTSSYQNLQTRAATHQFLIDATEKMRIDSSGNLLVGKTTTNSATNGFEAQSSGEVYVTRTNARCMALRRSAGSGTMIEFFRDATSVGSIVTATSSTTYNTSSDVRLKENIVDAPAGNIDAIRVRSFDWKVDGSHQTYGMVAQELVDVAPEAVSQGETEDDMWGVDYSKLVPMMIKEIQDLKAEVAALKGA